MKRVTYDTVKSCFFLRSSGSTRSTNKTGLNTYETGLEYCTFFYSLIQFQKSRTYSLTRSITIYRIAPRFVIHVVSPDCSQHTFLVIRHGGFIS